MERFSTSLLAFGLLAGCAATPPSPMAADNPANPSAPEAAVRPLHNTLETDSLTRKSRQILAQSAKEQQHWDQGGPIQDRASPSPTAPPQPMPGMAMPPE